MQLRLRLLVSRDFDAQSSAIETMISPMKHKHFVTFGSVMVVAWAVGTFLFIYFWPHLVNNRFKRAIVDQGFGGGPVPINTLYTEPQKLFADPLASLSASGRPNLMTTGVNHDTLLTVGWLDLSKGPLILHVPGFAGRYYSVQFTDPFDVDFAYVGTRTTGTQSGEYLIAGPNWKGPVPSGTKQISSPNNSVLVIGRVLVYSDSDLPTAYSLAKQIRLTPFEDFHLDQRLHSPTSCVSISDPCRVASHRITKTHEHPLASKCVIPCDLPFCATTRANCDARASRPSRAYPLERHLSVFCNPVHVFVSDPSPFSGSKSCRPSRVLAREAPNLDSRSHHATSPEFRSFSNEPAHSPVFCLGVS
jgi:Protein of unknown function (DUF1254)